MSLYKIFPEKLEWRIEALKHLLRTEFSVVDKRIERGECALPYYYGLENDARRYEISKSEISRAEWICFLDGGGKPTDKVKMRAAHSDKGYTLEIEAEGTTDYIRIDPEFKMFHRKSPIFLKDGGLEIRESAGYSLFGKRLEKRRSIFTCQSESSGSGTRYRLDFPTDALEMKKGDPFRLMISVYREGKRCEVLEKDDRTVEKLVLGKFSPDAFVFFVPI